MRAITLACLGLSWAFLLGCGGEADATKQELPPIEEESGLEPGVWLKVELPGTVCANGSQYKFFINPSLEGSKDVLFMFEPGGACWDYDSCAGRTGLGASNTEGLTDGHVLGWQLAFPFLRRSDATNQFRDFNYVYLPYCTGDVHIGNIVRTYTDPLGKDPDLVFHHNGYTNMTEAAKYAATLFKNPPRLVVAGCSAGGAGAIAGHYFVRQAFAPERAYLIDDSGPLFPGSVHSKPLYDTIQEAWNLESIFSTLPITYDKNDMGGMVLKLSEQLPDDRLSVTYFLRDHTFSAYSYERFFPDLDEEGRLDYWREDTDLLTAAFATRKNLAYYLPYWRDRVDSHCTMVLDYNGTEIQEAGVNLSDFVDNVLDDASDLKSYRESPQSGEDGTP
jgi:Pectinacetylesterase